MKLFHRRDAPPADVVAHLPPGERVVSWADVAERSGGGVVLASPAGIWWPQPEGPRLIGWQYVSKAVWHDRVLSVIEADVVDDLLLVDRAPVGVELVVPRDLPPTIRRRVTANVVESELVDLPGGQARLVARRVPGADGLRWWGRLERGTPNTAQVRHEVQAGLQRLRAAHEATLVDS